MNKTVWKYELDKHPGIAKLLELPQGASALRVSFQGDVLCIWLCVVENLPKENRLFSYTATGQAVPISAKYVGSATHSTSGTEWHAWEL